MTAEPIAPALQARRHRALVIPAYDYSRVERVKVALVSALSQGAFKEGDLVLCMTGRVGHSPDTLMQMRIGGSLEDRVAIEGIKLGEGFDSQVVDALFQLALQIGQEGFEGHPIGTIITIGDHNNVLEKSRQITLNPFQGLGESERNVLDPKMREAIKNFSVLDGAFVIRADGVVLSAGRYLSATDEDVTVPLGLGARHAAAAGHHRQHRVLGPGGEPDVRARCDSSRAGRFCSSCTRAPGVPEPTQTQPNEIPRARAVRAGPRG